ARGRHGLVRRCHGDMHLGNICLFEGKPTPFDAIEFSKEIATIDVIYDLAFPVMDLLAWDRPALANQLMNRYFEKTADYHATDLLPLLISLRAAIRAMTAALAAPNKPASESCRRYLGVALTALEPRPTPRLIAVGGLSGTGKTTFARLLAPHLCGPEGAVILRSDVIRKIHIGIEAELSAPQSAYEPSVTAFVYGRMMKMASKALRSGRTVILDAAFLSPPERQTCRRLAEQLGIQLTGFWLEAPHDVLEERIINRTDDASDATCSVLAKQEEYDCGSIDWINLNTRDGCMAHVETALQAVGLSSE
ncbi:MAG: AAA family ATPase, partial [Pseudomonadota bacterium]